MQSDEKADCAICAQSSCGVAQNNAADAGSIIHTSWNEAYKGLVPEEMLAAQTSEKCTARAQRYSECYRIAYIDGEAAGTVCFVSDARDFCTHRDGGEIQALYVLERFQRQGVGSALMQTVYETLGQRGITLFVLDGNDKAIDFYKKQGFVFTGSELNEGGVTELEMYKGNTAQRPPEGFVRNLLASFPSYYTFFP